MARKIYILLMCLMLVMSSKASAGTTYIRKTIGNALPVTSGADTYDSITVYKTKSGDVTVQSDDCDFKGTNAAVRVSRGASPTIKGTSIISTDATYGNAVFSYGGDLTGKSPDGTTITITNAKITTLKRNSGGIMVTGGGIIKATSLDINTSGDSSAAIRSDKGGGTITVNKGAYTTKGKGSPAVYSTANISVSSADLVSHASQGVVIEGGNSVTLTDSVVTASHTKKNGQDSTHQAILIYQSQSGDASDGKGTFTMTGGSITNAQGDIFLATNTYCTINLESVDITNNDSGYFLRAEGQKWGTSGSNGGRVVLNATDQKITGDILIGSSSRLNMTLSDASTFTGAINSSGSAGAVKVTVGAGSTWTLTGNSYISALSKDESGTITIPSGYTLYVNGTRYENGTSAGEYDDSGDTPASESDTDPSITTDSLTNGTVGKSISQTLKAAGTKPFTWSAEDLPDGLSFTSAGKLSGKVLTAGSYDIKFTVTNSEGSTSKTLRLKVLDVKPTIKATVSAGKIGYAYKATFTNTAGTGDITWGFSGNLPNGLSFDLETLTLEGTPTEAFSEYITVTATNTAGTASKKAKLTIKGIKPVFTFPNFESAVKGSPYVGSVGLDGSDKIELTITNLPDGVSYDYSSIDKFINFWGTPTEEGKFSVKFTAVNAGGKVTKTKKLVVDSKPEIITEETLKDATVGKNYSFTFKANGSKKITWSISDGAIPTGMTLKGTTGKLGGKASEAGGYSFTVRADNNYGTDSKDFTLEVKAEAPKIKTSSLKKGKAGSAYTSTIKATGTAPLSWSCDGDLPGNIEFKDGTFSGTPTESFNGTVTVSVENSEGTDTKTYALVIKPVAPKITTKTLPSGTTGKAYIETLEATGTTPITWSWSNFPSGLDIDSDTGIISGTPTRVGTFKTKITATNEARSVNKTIKIVITEGETTETTNKTKESNELESETNELETLPEVIDEELTLETDASASLPEGCIIAAELPALSVDVSGMYDLDAVLRESAPVGAKLYWSAGASTPSDDDDIAEFADAEGQEIESVPESREVIVSVWLNEGITYKPVIYVKP